jgi:16S rRNA (uracil1498-N3)-methyltransferase
MEYFFSSPENIGESDISIRDVEFHHLTQVMRKKAGDEIMVVNGQGTAYDCVINRISRDEAFCTIQEVYNRYNEPGVSVTLMLPILKNHSRVEWIVEKGTELGVTRFVPVHTERSIPHRIRYERLQKIAFAAMKQCRRSCLPFIEEGTNFEALLHSADGAYEKIFMGHETAPQAASLRRAAEHFPGQRVLLLAGPEGGFSEREIKLCEENGGQIVSLGTRRYRAETAALLMAIFLIQD